jgi:cation transport ATPase
MEAKLIRDMLSPLDAVNDVKISLVDRRVNVEHRATLASQAIVELLNTKHLGASLQDRSVVETVGSSFNNLEKVRLTVNVTQVVLFAFTVALVWQRENRAALAVGWSCVMLSFALFHEAYLALRRRSPNVELMMAIAMAGALVQGDVVEAASVGVLVTLMDLVKVLALEAVARRLRGSVVSEPLSVEVPGGAKKLLSALAVGDVYVLRVGDVAPADGSIVAGTAALDESRVTGEALPQMKRTGERVLSGAVVSTGFMHVRTETPVDASFQARVASVVEEAQSTLSDVEALVGRFATWYTPVVLILAAGLGLYKGLDQCLVVLVAGCPCALLGAAPFVQGATLTLLAGRHRLLVKRATTLESLARIRAVGFDKTGTLTTGQFELLRLEALPWTTETTAGLLHRWVAAVEDQDSHPIARGLVASYKGCAAEFIASGLSLPVASGFQRHGRDGVSAVVDGRLVGVGNAKFLRACAGGAGASIDADEDEEKEEDLMMPSRMRAARKRKRRKEIGEQREVAVRQAAALASDREDHGGGDRETSRDQPTAAAAADAALLFADTLCREIASDWAESGSVLFVVVEGIAAGVMLLEDTVKPEAAATVERLKRLGVDSLLLTGDRLSAARRCAKVVGISEANTYAGLLPEDKQRHLLARTWPVGQDESSGGSGGELEARMLPKARRGPLEVGFVGDGLNDCPALASAHVGIVLLEVGSQATVDAASALLQVNIDQLPSAIVVARRAQRLVAINLCLALAINVSVIALAATTGLPLWLSVLSDSGGLLVVLANSLWPLTWRVGAAAPRA